MKSKLLFLCSFLLNIPMVSMVGRNCIMAVLIRVSL